MRRVIGEPREARRGPAVGQAVVGNPRGVNRQNVSRADDEVVRGVARRDVVHAEAGDRLTIARVMELDMLRQVPRVGGDRTAEVDAHVGNAEARVGGDFTGLTMDVERGAEIRPRVTKTMKRQAGAFVRPIFDGIVVQARLDAGDAAHGPPETRPPLRLRGTVSGNHTAGPGGGAHDEASVNPQVPGHGIATDVHPTGVPGGGADRVVVKILEGFLNVVGARDGGRESSPRRVRCRRWWARPRRARRRINPDPAGGVSRRPRPRPASHAGRSYQAGY